MREKMEGGTRMSEEMEEMRCNSTGVDVNEREVIFCPVCGMVLCEDNLVDLKSVVEDSLYYVGGVRIVNSRVLLHCECEHCHDENGFSIESHPLIAVVRAVFDFRECVHFEIVEILAG